MTDSNERLKIPAKLKVGFRKREDTYSKKLAYVTYINNKNEIAKEKSWSGWIREEDYPIEDYDNTPMDGFVLNKKVGGYASGWNHRNTYCRVYDPRGFEIEISVENLLYILQECTSSKGKGLEGEFVYAWDGKDLVLLPVSSPDYIASTELQNKTENLTPKMLKIGGLYKGKDSETLVYLGKINFDKVSSFSKEIRKTLKFNYYSGAQPTSRLTEGMFFTFYDPEKEKLYTYRTLGKHLDYLKEENYMSLSDVEDVKDKFFGLYQFRFGKGAKKIYIEYHGNEKLDESNSFGNDYAKAEAILAKAGYNSTFLYRVSDTLIYDLQPIGEYAIDGKNEEEYLISVLGKKKYNAILTARRYYYYGDKPIIYKKMTGCDSYEEDNKALEDACRYFNDNKQAVLTGLKIKHSYSFNTMGIYDTDDWRTLSPSDIDITKLFGDVYYGYDIILEYEDGTMLSTDYIHTLDLPKKINKQHLF